MPDRITIFDTTLRDGEQAPGFSLRVNEKLQLARQLDALGVDVIEAGFPIASEADAEAVRAVAAEVSGRSSRRWRDAGPTTSSAPASRSSPPPGRASTPSSPRPICTSTRKLKITREQCLEAAVAAVTQARSYTDDVQFSAEDATRSDIDFLCRVDRSGHQGRRHDDQPARHGRLLHARRNQRVLPRPSSAACRTPTRRSSARTATTTSGSRWRTRSRRCRRACGRWSARSTASASAPATRRSKRS